MTDVVLVIGTRKGLFTARSTGSSGFRVSPVRLRGNAVPAVAVDTRRSPVRLLASTDSGHWGPSVCWSDDLGETWREGARPPVAFPAGSGAALERVWQLTPSPTEPDVVWAGVEPAALFRSEDRGESFTLVEGLWEHPHRQRWTPGGGGLCLHSVLPHPADPKTLGVAISVAGFYRSTDGGQSFEAANTGIRAAFLPEGAQYPEFGQCVHKIGCHPARPDRIFLQHHYGVYRSDDGGAGWHDVGAGLPGDFGFPLLVHPHRPDTVYVFPLHGDADRTPWGHRYQVWRTDDAGRTWSPSGTGLPAEPAYGTVLRDAMCTDGADPAGVYFGTRCGEVFAGRHDGQAWSTLARHLPDVLCLRAAVL